MVHMTGFVVDSVEKYNFIACDDDCVAEFTANFAPWSWFSATTVRKQMSLGLCKFGATPNINFILFNFKRLRILRGQIAPLWMEDQC